VVAGALEQQFPLDFCCVCLAESGAAESMLAVTTVGPRSDPAAWRIGLQIGARVDVGQNGLSRCLTGQLAYEPDLRQVSCPLAVSLASDDLRSLVVAPLSAEKHVFGLLIAARRAVGAFSSSECEFLKQMAEHTALAAQQARLYTELQTAYDDLRRTQQSVMQQERLRALGQMASGIAHDINNALSPAALYAQSLLETEASLSPEAREQLRTIERSVVDVAKTVTRMRQFYRPRDAELSLDPVDLNTVVSHVVDLTRPKWSAMAQERGVVVKVDTDYAAELPPILGAENEISDAITNLVLNAVDAMPQGGTLSLRTYVTPTGGVCVEVRDTGVGMEESVRQRCLEPFFTTKGERGTGLGLAMVYGMAKRHDANLAIDSALGVGTTVRILFTQIADQVIAPDRRARRPDRAMRILAVEDDPLVLQSVRTILEQDGHDVYTADGGQSGIDVFAAAQANGAAFDVVITDLGMPMVDGRAVAAAIKSMSAPTPVILLTGWGQRLLEEGDMPPHVDRVLSKPPQLAQLREALADVSTPA
jgi:signal transduction histidine kinase/ActR/RegA family two-component response regulator